MKRILAIDANALIHRAYHALPPLKTEEGEIVGAVYGFLLILFKAIKDLNPQYIVAAFDYPAPTFRHKEYKEYKAHREKAPDELISQIPLVKEALEKFNVKVIEKKGFEADDIIGCVAKRSSKKNLETIVVTGDMDLLQLVDEKVKVYASRRGVKDTILYDTEKVKEKYKGLAPSQLRDYKALRGDPSDNIPGVAGVGEKTAIDLISRFGSLNKLYKNIEKVKPSLKENLKKNKEKALLSKHLVELKCDIPLENTIEDLKWEGYKERELIDFLKKYQFNTLIPRLEEMKGKDQLKII